MKQLTVFLLLSMVYFSHAQSVRTNVKFGDVSAADFATKVYSIDSNAQAVVLFDYGNVKYEGNNSGFFNVVYKYHKRIHILNKNAFDLATIEIPLYKRGLEEDKIEKLEAITHNFENGKVVSKKIDKSSIFKDKANKYTTIQKFTLPDLTEGCIIEYMYTISSPTPSTIRTWYFQGRYPVLWSEYNTTIPSWYSFVRTRQGYIPFVKDSSYVSSEYYSLLVPGEAAMDRSEVYSGNIPSTITKCAQQNIPAIKTENFVSSIRNHISNISFQLSAFRPFDGSPRRIGGNWLDVSSDLMKREDFGAELSKSAGWLESEAKTICLGIVTDREKAKKIFTFIRDNFTCNDYDDYSMNQPLKKVFQAKKGNVAEINLLLIAMYHSIGLTAKPVILSTRENGKAPVVYPILSRFNYTICQLELGNEKLLIDAAHKKLGFAKLTSECYNDFGRVVDEQMPSLVNLSSDSLLEAKLTSVYIINPEEGGGMFGTFKSTLGYFESLDMREELEKKKKEEVFADIKKSYSYEIDLSNTALDSLEVFEKPIDLKYDFKFSLDEDIIYFNPMLTEAYKTNPFKALTRSYPVEMPFKSSETYILNMEVPEGYAIDEMPKGARIKFNENDGMFEYLIGKVGKSLQLRCSLKMNIANFSIDDYATLRDFYGFIVQKQSEQIVFKKIKK